METHVRIVGGLFIVPGAFSLAFSLVGLFGMLLTPRHNTPQDYSTFFSHGLGELLSVLLMVVLCTLLMGLIAGVGLLHYQPWARWLVVIITVLTWPLTIPWWALFPVAPVLGPYILWVMLNKETAAIFNRPRG